MFYIFALTFSVAFIVANLLGATLLPFPWSKTLWLTSGTLVYPITFFISDLVTEIWGEKKARQMVLASFGLCLIPFFYQYAISKNFRISGILILSSLIAFLTAQLVDIRLFQMIKKLTGGRYLWLRNQFSTYISQIIDTWIVNSLLLFWGLHLEFQEGLYVILGNFLYKFILTILMAPLLYLAVKLISKKSIHETV